MNHVVRFDDRWLLWIKGALYGSIVFVLLAMHAGAQVVGDVGQAAGDLNPWANWQIILGFVLPLALQLITSRIHERSYQAWAAFGVSIVVTLIGMYIAGELNTATIDLVTTPLKVLVAVIAFYKGFWNPIGVTPSTGEARLR